MHACLIISTDLIINFIQIIQTVFLENLKISFFIFHFKAN